jgi:hypothetical protein
LNAPRSIADWVLSALLAIIVCAVTAAMLPVRVKPVLKLELSKNAVDIRDLDQPRNISRQVTHWVDVLDLARDGRLAHPRLGVLGLGDHYFLDLETRIQVPATASYRFEVRSDDGFALQIDERRVCAFTRDRSLTTQTCRVLLIAGEHDLRLSYFQAGGPAGLAVRYAVNADTAWRWLGEDSAQLRFIGD